MILVTNEKIYKLLIVYTFELGIALNNTQLVNGILLEVTTYQYILVILSITGVMFCEFNLLK